MAKGWSFGALIAALKGAAFLNVGTVANTVAAGDDWRITGAAQKGNNLADLTDYAKARNQLSAAHIYGDTNVKFWALDSPGDSNSVVTIGRLDTVAGTKANRQGDSNVQFYCSDSGNSTAAVNNQRLDFRLQSKADLSGNSDIDFYCRNNGWDTAAVNNQRLDFRLQSKANLKGDSNVDFYCRNNGDAAAAVNNQRLDFRLGPCSLWTRTGARRDFGVISRNDDKWLDAGWVVIGAGARGNENIQNLVLLGGRLQIYRADGGWVDSAT